MSVVGTLALIAVVGLCFAILLMQWCLCRSASWDEDAADDDRDGWVI